MHNLIWKNLSTAFS